MRILLLGGTMFLGRHLVEQALLRGHELTLFHRGRHGKDLFPAVERVLGDRDGELEKLDGRTWDVVIDTCGYVPRIVGDAAKRLADRIDRYAFISTLSVYPRDDVPGQDEQTPVAVLDDPTTETVDGATYGALKALCEEAVEAALPGRTLRIRPGLIVGPHDPTDRFTYWPARVARGGAVLVPEHPDWVTQFIDVRDLAGWTLDLVEREATGIYNATGPTAPLPFGQLLEACRSASGADATWAWAPASFLAEEKVGPWMEMPLWVPDTPEHAGFSRTDITKAANAGLAFRPVEQTVRDTLAFARSRPAEHTWRAGLDAEREAALLAKLSP